MENLFRLLDLKPKSSKTEVVQPETNSPPCEGELGWSDNAIVLDAWDLSRGKECLAKNAPLQMRGVSANAMADMYAVAFNDEHEFSRCIDKRRENYVKTLLESPECQSIRTSTVHNFAASEIAAVKFADGWADLLEKDKERRKNPPKDKKKGEIREASDLLKAVGKALSKASQEVEELEDTLLALGCGSGQYESGKMSTEEIARLFKRTKDSSIIHSIMAKAGRFRRVAQSKQRRKVHHGHDDVVGVEMGGDIEKLVPLELASLADDDLEMDALRRYIERQCIQRQYRGIENVGRGPIIVCVDESGSMKGEPVANAKAFALSMAYIARWQKRWCCLIGFAGGTEGTRCVLPPGKWDQNKLMDWLEHFYSGGTTVDVPIVQLPNKYWPELIGQGLPRGKTDLIFVTDGVVYIPDQTITNFSAWKKAEKVRLISLIVDCEPGQLAGVSDEVYRINSLSPDDSGIERCLSI